MTTQMSCPSHGCHEAGLVGALGPGAAAAVRQKANGASAAEPRGAPAINGKRLEAAHVEVEVDVGGWCGPSCVGELERERDLA